MKKPKSPWAPRFSSQFWWQRTVRDLHIRHVQAHHIDCRAKPVWVGESLESAHRQYRSRCKGRRHRTCFPSKVGERQKKQRLPRPMQRSNLHTGSNVLSRHKHQIALGLRAARASDCPGQPLVTFLTSIGSGPEGHKGSRTGNRPQKWPKCFPGKIRRSLQEQPLWAQVPLSKGRGHGGVFPAARRCFGCAGGHSGYADGHSRCARGFAASLFPGCALSSSLPSRGSARSIPVFFPIVAKNPYLFQTFVRW